LLIGLTQALRKLGVLGSGAVTQIKLSDNFCVSPGLNGLSIYIPPTENKELYSSYGN
jgi:hypothetical protein